MRSLVVGAALAVVAATPALAQRVRGTLTDSSTREPVTGAVVTISDSAGRFLARGIAGGDGRFDVPRFPGSKQIHVVRIGYRPIDATVPAADELLDLHMHAIASQLSTVTTSGKRVCPGDDANSQALQLWEQARTGFLAAVVARDGRPPNLRLRYFRIQRDPMVRHVVDDTVWAKTIVGDQPFVAARSATRVRERGLHARTGGRRPRLLRARRRRAPRRGVRGYALSARHAGRRGPRGRSRHRIRASRGGARQPGRSSRHRVARRHDARPPDARLRLHEPRARQGWQRWQHHLPVDAERRADDHPVDDPFADHRHRRIGDVDRDSAADSRCDPSAAASAYSATRCSAPRLARSRGPTVRVGDRASPRSRD